MIYPGFVDNDTFFRLDRSSSEHEQLTAMTNNLKTVHNLTTQHFEDFNGLIAAYLRAGVEIFQMQTGIVSHITDDKKYVIKDVVTPLIDILHKDDVFELEGTYCREVAKTGRTLGFPHVGKMEGMKTHPVYENLKLESYISAPIYVRSKLYGTLNFTSTEPREFGFSEMEHDLISMLANAIGNFILLQEKEQSLLMLNNRLKEMVGYVAHDLRNPIGNILTTTEMIMTFGLEGKRRDKAIHNAHRAAENALELINSILDAAALGTGKITLSVAPFKLSELVQEVLSEHTVLAQQRQISWKIDIPATLTIAGDASRLRQVFNNLLINALKYAPAQSSVTIKAEPSEEANAVVTIANQVASDDATALDGSLYRSVGFGLDIVGDILKLHGSDMDIESTPDAYRVGFCLPLSEQ